MTAAEKEYGGALYDLAVEEHCEDAVLEGFALAADAFGQMPEYLKLVQNPALPAAERLGLLDEAFGGAHPYVLNFLKILCEKSALALTGGCLAQYWFGWIPVRSVRIRVRSVRTRAKARLWRS